MALSLPFSESLISSHYGKRWWNGVETFHTGTDFAVAGQRAIPASEAGVVTKVQYTSLKGYQVEIQHGSVARTRYHMLDADTPVRVGDSVSKGQTIGRVASQRYSPNAAWTGPHLHFEVWYPFTTGSNPQYTHMDPLGFIRGQNEPASGGNYVPIPNTPTNQEFDLSQQQYNEISERLSWIADSIGGSNSNNAPGVRNRVTDLQAEVAKLRSEVDWLKTRIGGSHTDDTIAAEVNWTKTRLGGSWAGETFTSMITKIKTKLGA